MSTVPEKQASQELERAWASIPELEHFQAAVARHNAAALEFERAVEASGWRRFFARRPGRELRAAVYFEQVQAEMLDAAARLSQLVLEASGATPAEMRVSADEFDGLRRMFDEPDAGQGERVREFLAKTPSPPRA